MNKKNVKHAYATKIGFFRPILSANCPEMNDPKVKKINIKQVLIICYSSLIYH